MSELKQIFEKLQNLERRIVSLEGVIHKRGGLASAVRRVVEMWPGPFTATQIRDAVYETTPDLRPVVENYQVEATVRKMEKQSLILCTMRGAGPNPNIYEINPSPPASACKSGMKWNAHRDNESGFRGIVRAALDELPAQWTIEDLRKWVGEKLPNTTIPYGSWSSTLYKMTQQEELTVVRGGGRGKGSTLKVFIRGPRQIAATGQEVRELEASWKEFRASLNIQPPPEMLSGLERAEKD